MPEILRSRRSVLLGLLAAPAIVRASSLMAISPLRPDSIRDYYNIVWPWTSRAYAITPESIQEFDRILTEAWDAYKVVPPLIIGLSR